MGVPDIDMLPEPTSSVCLCGFPELHCEVSEWSGSGKTCETSTDCPSEGCGGMVTCGAPPHLPAECGASNQEQCFYVAESCVPHQRPPIRLVPDIDMLPEPTSSVCLCGFPELHCEVSEWPGSGRTCEMPTDCPPEGCGGMVTCGAPPHLPAECGASNQEQCFYVAESCVPHQRPPIRLV